MPRNMSTALRKRLPSRSRRKSQFPSQSQFLSQNRLQEDHSQPRARKTSLQNLHPFQPSNPRSSVLFRRNRSRLAIRSPFNPALSTGTHQKPRHCQTQQTRLHLLRSIRSLQVQTSCLISWTPPQTNHLNQSAPGLRTRSPTIIALTRTENQPIFPKTKSTPPRNSSSTF